MAHFAKIENGIVKNVIVLKNKDCGGGDLEHEAIGQAFIESLGFDGEWLQTSYNKNFRGNFAGIGLTWNGSVFHGPSPYPSWILDNDGKWGAPSVKPEGNYSWDEDSVSWIEVLE